MIFSWLRRKRREKLLRSPFPQAWLPWLEALPFYAHLSADQQARLRDDLRIFVAEKSWEGCGGLNLTDEMKVIIAAQACLLTLELDHDHYPNVSTILVYPSTYRTQDHRDAAGVVRSGQANLGEAWPGGPVILAWDSIQGDVTQGADGRNLVFHELAHKLDMRDGLADGTPPLKHRAMITDWVRVMTKEYERLRDASEHGHATLLDHYGATNPAEFFAVATECFFEKGRHLERRHPELYAVLCEYYGQSPR